MATHEDLRRIASALPGAIESPDGLVFSVEIKGKLKGFVWPWAERVHPKKARVINPDVLAVVVPGLQAKEIILASDPSVYFTEEHYNGFPAVLVRLEAISVEDLQPLIIEAWKCKAPPAVARAFDEG